MRKILFTGMVALAFFSCNKGKINNSEKPLAKVYDRYLYPSELKGVIPVGISAQDSIAMSKDFIEKWVRNQILLNTAEMNLTDKEKDVENQIDNYKSSLLIYAYEQRYLQQKLDTVVSDSTILAYYKENQPNFILGETLVKGLFIKLSVKAPELYKVRQWYRSEKPEDLNNLEGYCFNNALVYNHFNDGWVNVNEILRMIPSGSTMVNSLLSRKYLETSDKDHFYFISLKEIAPEGTVSPFELVKNNIYSIILNKRKVTLINELESGILSDAQNREKFTIY
ncbi:MAG TPA: hypothetical protein VK179_01345 [Bacteroidales bacterium]|nr:hypothetical protein [Bacteroidales bacterium]